MKRRIGLILVFGAALPLAVVSAAWACGVLATASLDSGVAAPGQTVHLTGKNYSQAAPVEIRLKSRTSAAIATAAVNSSNRIDTTFALPASLSPGWYVVLVTQTVNGVTKSGTPGRTSVRVQGSKAADNVPAAWASSPSGPGGTSLPMLPIALAMALSLAMLASGWALVGRARRSVAGPQLGV